MAKPKIFISSTYYDLKHIRNNLKSFILGYGYEPVLFEEGDITFDFHLPLDESCYLEIQNCHMLILIIGGRYGSPKSSVEETLLSNENENKLYENYTSITEQEYLTAVKNNIPSFVFIRREVLGEYRTYQMNKSNENIIYAHVDNVSIFKLIELIYQKKSGNFIKEFNLIEDITNWLKFQWAGLFTKFLNQEKVIIELKSANEQLKELKTVTDVIKKYSESIMNKIKPVDFEKLIKEKTQNIDLKKAERFCSEDLIVYILSTGFDEDSIFIFEKFNTSDSFEIFLEKLGLDEKIKIKILTETNLSLAESDYQSLKKIYSQ